MRESGEVCFSFLSFLGLSPNPSFLARPSNKELFLSVKFPGEGEGTVSVLGEPPLETVRVLGERVADISTDLERSREAVGGASEFEVEERLPCKFKVDTYIFLPQTNGV